MSLKVSTVPPVPELTARLVRAAFPKGNVYLTMRDELGVFYEDELFRPLFATRGQPAETPWRLAMVCVMQYMEGLTDRQAADAVRARLDWKYVLSLEADDAGFDFSVLSEFRDRLLAGAVEQELLDRLLATCREQGWLKARGRQRTASTHVLAAIRTLNRLELVGETLRAALNALAIVAPAWLQSRAAAEWFDRYSRRIEDYRLPQGKDARASYGQLVGQDGQQRLEWIWHEESWPWLRQVPAVEVLRQIWLQQFVIIEGELGLRALEDLPPATLRLASPYDAQARYATKRTTHWTGYKVHLTETCDEAMPHVITQVTTTAAPVTDQALAQPIQDALVEQGLTPREQLLDAGYVDATFVVRSHLDHDITIRGPVQPDRQWQAQLEGGYDLSTFTIDWTTCSATCPEGHMSSAWLPHQDEWGNRLITVKFAREHCNVCPARERCTRGKVVARQLTLREQAEHEALQAARVAQQTAAWEEQYAARAGVEGTLSQAIRTFDLRQTRYIGLPKTHLQHILTATAINVERVIDHLQGRIPGQTRVSSFAALAPAA